MWARRSLQVLPRAWAPIARPVVYRYSFASYSTAQEDGAAFRKKLQADLVTSMKSGDAAKLAAVRLIKSKITYKDKESGAEVDNDAITQVLLTMLNTAIETEAEMKSHNREDLAQKERVLIDTINTYVPKQLTRDELKVEAQAVITSLNATSIKDMGKVVEALSKSLKGRTQPKIIGEVAKELLLGKK